MQLADNNSWIMTCSILKRMKKTTDKAPKGVLREIGLRNLHSYSVIDVREVILDNGEIEYLVFLRNPTGNFFMKDHEIWKGDWGMNSSKWTDKVRKQVNYYVTPKDVQKAQKK